MMKNYITLTDTIQQELKEHPELKIAYQKESLINDLAQGITKIRKFIQTEINLNTYREATH